MEANDILKVEAQFLQNGVNFAENVWHFFVHDVVGIDVDAILDEVRLYVENLYSLWLSDAVDASIQGTELKFSSATPPDTEFTALGSRPFTTTFSSGGDIIPLGSAGLVRYVLNNSGRLGGKYLFGLSTGHINNSALVAGTLADIAAFGAASAATYLGNLTTLTPCVYRPDGTHTLFEGTAIPRNAIAYQRRRKQNVGE